MADVMGARIQVPPQLADLPAQVTSSCLQIEDMLALVNARLVALQAFWTGTGSDGHTVTQQQWHAAESGLLTGVGVLGSVARAAQVNWQNYVDGEAAVTQSWAH